MNNIVALALLDLDTAIVTENWDLVRYVRQRLDTIPFQPIPIVDLTLESDSEDELLAAEIDHAVEQLLAAPEAEEDMSDSGSIAETVVDEHAAPAA